MLEVRQGLLAVALGAARFASGAARTPAWEMLSRTPLLEVRQGLLAVALGEARFAIGAARTPA